MGGNNFCVYLMISLNSPAFLSLNQSCQSDIGIQHPTVDFSSHQQWNPQRGWKNALNNLQLIIQPKVGQSRSISLVGLALHALEDIYRCVFWHWLVTMTGHWLVMVK